MKKLLSRILDLLYPPKCVLCTALLKEGEIELCESCSKIKPIHGLIHRGSFFDHCCSVYPYKDPVSSAVKRLKFGGREHYASCFGKLLARKLVQEEQSFDAITWVPVSPKRKRKRGYDQAQLIALAVGKELDVPVLPTLKKIRHNAPQAMEASAAARRANVLDAYVSLYPSQIAGKRFLVVDDVITSAATLSECCRILKMAGAKSLICGTFAAAGE